MCLPCQSSLVLVLIVMWWNLQHEALKFSVCVVPLDHKTGGNNTSDAQWATSRDQMITENVIFTWEHQSNHIASLTVCFAWTITMHSFFQNVKLYASLNQNDFLLHFKCACYSKRITYAYYQLKCFIYKYEYKPKMVFNGMHAS